jgi:inorganic pyrophosphatase/exopolyphosphatase
MVEKEIIITSGGKYIDIDTLACGVAYNKLLNSIGKPNRLILLGGFTESVSETVKTWDYKLENSFTNDPYNYLYVLVDISEPSYFSNFVVSENILEVYDHRWGFEKIWKDKIGNGAKIEMVGACATLIWEEFQKNNVEQKIDFVSANLLYTAILSNTLNFKAQITTQRDIDASVELLKYTHISPNWREKYFNEINESVIKNPIEALKEDTKEVTLNGIKYKIRQLELWDSTNFIEDNKEALFKLLEEDENLFSFMTSPSISQGINYIVCSHPETQDKLEKIINVKFDGVLGRTDKLWLRKEIIRELAK